MLAAGLLAGLLMLALACPLYAFEDDDTKDAGPSPPPMSFEQSRNAVRILDEDEVDRQKEKTEKVGTRIRIDALKEAALSYGARAGLAWRTFQVQRRLAENDGNISQIFNFHHLLIAAPSGLLIEPPVVSEAQKAVLVASGGQSAAVADRVYRINRTARIVTAPRNWRAYLERDWGKVDPPPQALYPKSAEEMQHWRMWMDRGWEEGVRQADDVFQSDLDRLNTDYLGMIRYREMLAHGMITPPYATQEDRGVTGNGNEMRIGDRGLQITGPPQFNQKSDRWITAPR
jgi:defect-in-organelle-trafficking protein DotC